jgi:PAS domain S-box-containing protein
MTEQRIMVRLYRWLRANTSAPYFLSGRWSHPLSGYLIAFVGQLTTALTLFIFLHFPSSFHFPEGPLLLIILLIALGWGTGPSLIAIGIGAPLLAILMSPHPFSSAISETEDGFGFCLYIIVGLTISFFVRKTEQSRFPDKHLHSRLNVTPQTIPEGLPPSERKRIEEQASFLAEVSKVLASTLDYQQTLTNIAQLVVPELADWFAVDLIDAQRNFELIEVVHTDPEQVQWARTLRERYPIDLDTPTSTAQVARTGQSALYEEITDEMLVAAARTEEGLAIARRLGCTSIMIVPLMARGKTFGVVTFISTAVSRKYDRRDLALAEEVGRRAGMALDNARLYQEVAQARDQLDIILQGVADGIIVYNTFSKIIYANTAAAQLMGYHSTQDLQDAVPHNIAARYEIVDEQGIPIPGSQLTHTRVLAGEREARAIIGYTKSGHDQPKNWSLVTSRPVLNEQGKVVLVVTIIHDMTERVLTERRKDEFISMASHELKTPVTSLKGFLAILQRRLAQQADEQGLYYLTRMDNQLSRLTKLIGDILDISKMQAGKLALEMEPFDLDTLIEEIIENVQAATPTHQLTLEGKTNSQIQGDKDRLGQVFINLLTNAVKYSPRADRVQMSLYRDQKQAMVSVQDFGIGIHKAQHQKIFERFYQVAEPKDHTYPGLGIGLYIAREIVERHHGQIWVESNMEEGSTFFVSLPILAA